MSRTTTLLKALVIISVFLLLNSQFGSLPGANATEKPSAMVPANTLKLAILVPATSIPALGEPARDGALLAIEQKNASGGILGMSVEPVIEETNCEPTTAVYAANKVINQDGVRYIIGDVCSSSSIAISEIANTAGVIQMTPTATGPEVTMRANGRVKEYVFRACFIDQFQASAAARFAHRTLSAQKAYIMLNWQSSYSRSLAEVFRTEFSRLGTIVGTEVYDPTDVVDYSALLHVIAVAKPDVVYLPDYYNVVNLITEQAKERGITASFIGGDGWDSGGLDLAAAGGSYFTNHWSSDDPRSEVTAFNQAFTGRYGYAPDATAALSYDSANLLFQAMQEAGTTDTTAVTEKLATISFQGVSGSLFYDANHNPIKSVPVMRVGADGVHFFALVPPMRKYIYLPLVFRHMTDSFWADRYQLEPGECTSIRWSVIDALAVYLNDVAVVGDDSRLVCPTETTTYVLRVERESTTQEYRLTVVVDSSN